MTMYYTRSGTAALWHPFVGGAFHQLVLLLQLSYTVSVERLRRRGNSLPVRDLSL